MDHDQVHDRASFIDFLGFVRETLRDDPTEIENVDLARFLEAMQAWSNDSTGPASINPWRHAADLIGAALVYE